MKKVLLSAVAILSLTFANAQEEETTTTGFGFAKGDIFVEGNLGFSSSKNTNSDNFAGNINETKMSSFNFNPKAGYFFTDKLAAGVEVMVGSSKNEMTDFTVIPNTVTETKGSSVGAGVFARYYFLELGQRFKTYTEVGVGFSSAKSETTDSTSPVLVNDVTMKGVNAGLDLGIQYFVTPKMAINFGLANVLAFNSTKAETTTHNLLTPNTVSESKTDEFSGNFNIFNNFFSAATFGLTYKF